MFIGPRRRRRTGRFRSGRMRTERERKEYLISLYTTAAVRVGLGVGLLVAAVQAFRAAQMHAQAASVALRLFLPAAFALGALFALRSGVRSFREAGEIRATPLLAEDADED